jgi:hypothetical protein
MDPLPCSPAGAFLYGNFGHCFSGSAEKMAADVNFGGAVTFAPIYKAEGQHQNNIFLYARVPSSKPLGKAKRAGYCSPVVALMARFSKRMQQKAISFAGPTPGSSVD